MSNRVQLQCRVDPETKESLTTMANHLGTTRGPLIDDLVRQLTILYNYTSSVAMWKAEDLDNPVIRESILNKAKSTLTEVQDIL